MKEPITSPQAPAAIGPYSAAISTGSLIFVSGQLPINPATGEMPEGIAAQTEQSLRNLKALLEAAGSSVDKVVKTTVFLADINDFAAMNEVFPTRSAFAVAALPKGAQVEIECIALA